MDFLFLGGDDEEFDFENDVQKQKYKDLMKKLKSFYIKSYEKEKKEYESFLKYRLEYVDIFTRPEQVNKIIRRNMDKFDDLTSRGYTLDLLTGEFKLSS